jgi:2'-5' RNA ligase
MWIAEPLSNPQPISFTNVKCKKFKYLQNILLLLAIFTLITPLPPIQTKINNAKKMASTSPSHFQLSSTKTALALLVPSHLQPEINALRKIHDKAYRKWEPHINILYPFVDPSVLSPAVSTLRSHLYSNPISPFKVKIENVGTFEHRRNATVFLKPGDESEEKISALRKTLVTVLGREETEGTHDGVFRPHLTIGQAALTGLMRQRLVEKVRKLVGLEWEVEGLVVLRREETGEMAVVEEISLRGSRDEKDESESLVRN